MGVEEVPVDVDLKAVTDQLARNGGVPVDTTRRSTSGAWRMAGESSARKDGHGSPALPF